MEITTARLLLREYVDDDWPAFLAYQADPRAQEFFGPGEGDPDRLRALVPVFARWAAEVPRRNWQLALTRREVPTEVIGSAGLRQAGEPAGVAQLGLEVAPTYWGQGYATEAARALLTVGFASLDLEAVRGVTVSANERVARLVRRLGFQRVGDADGPSWLAARGWRETTWELTRARWLAAGRAVDGAP